MVASSLKYIPSLRPGPASPPPRGLTFLLDLEEQPARLTNCVCSFASQGGPSLAPRSGRSHRVQRSTKVIIKRPFLLRKRLRFTTPKKKEGAGMPLPLLKRLCFAHLCLDLFSKKKKKKPKKKKKTHKKKPDPPRSAASYEVKSLHRSRIVQAFLFGNPRR
jgi:hypothetical protein